MTKHGFISIVKFDAKKDKEKRSNRERKSWGKNPLLVRARLTGDIEQLRPYFSKLKVYEDKGADYSARAIVPATRVAEWLWYSAFEIDYDSHFKEVAQANSPGGSAEGSMRHSAYMSCWTALAKMQHTPPYGGYGSSYGYGGSYRDPWEGYSSSTGTTYGGGSKSTYSGSSSTSNYQANTKVEKSQIGAITDGTRPQIIDKSRTKPYDSNDPESMPESVLDMCEALLVKKPSDIRTDPATPYATYDIWCICEDDYDTPVSLSNMVAVLAEYIDDPLTSPKARDEASDVYEEFRKRLSVSLENELDLDDHDVLVDEVVSLLGTPEAD